MIWFLFFSSEFVVLFVVLLFLLLFLFCFVCFFFFFSSIFFVFQGVPPIHTPLANLEALPEDVRRRIRVVHCHGLPASSTLSIPRCGIADTLVLPLNPLHEGKKGNDRNCQQKKKSIFLVPRSFSFCAIGASCCLIKNLFWVRRSIFFFASSCFNCCFHLFQIVRSCFAGANVAKDDFCISKG